MTADLDRFRADYAAAFDAHLTGTGETGLESAYELGRKAVTGGLSLLDLAGVHHGVLADSLQDADPSQVARISTAANAFFLESLGTFEMASRGFQEAHETAQLQARHASQLRGLAEASLAVNSTLSTDEMLDLVATSAREIIGANRSMLTMQADAPQPDEEWLTAPLIDREGRRLGVIQVADKQEAEFTQEDESILLQLAQMASVALENARLYEHERDIAASLQRALLPARLPEISGVTHAVRYVAGGAGVEVGGDWYALIPRPNGSVGIAIGDVVGRGVRAASIMGQLRIALRAYALEFADPSVVLRRLARFAQTLPEDQMTTCVYVAIDPENGSLRFTNAGHPPPLIVKPDGSVEYLEGARAMPLGVTADPEYEESDASLEPGSTVLLYTDGLVERRGESIDTGLERLRTVVADAPREPELLCDRLLEVLVDNAPGDDVALLAVRALPQDLDPLDLTLPADPSTLADLRRTLRDWLDQAGASEEEVRDIVLATVEAAANAVEHAYGPGDAQFELEAHSVDGEITITVQDHGSWRTESDPHRGRGLGVMRAAMDGVEVNSESEGTRVRLRRRLRGGSRSG
ncbi:MAG TPA: SpoIIE family protein phosphatase [Thermoleophilaceae bacterium]|nr:SpoIIE family protein phosphatase [Thermoleophilaceae bacterium]